jgi:hypothetical protein
MPVKYSVLTEMQTVKAIADLEAAVEALTAKVEELCAKAETAPSKKGR